MVRRKRKPTNMSHKVDEDIKRVFKARPKKQLSFKQIFKVLNGNYSKKELFNGLSILIREKFIVEAQKNRYKLKVEKKLTQNIYEGVVDMTRSGDAFVVCNKLNRDIYINGKNLNAAMDGDVVRVRLFEKSRGRSYSGVVIKVLERAQTQFVGTINSKADKVILIPDKKNMSVDIQIQKGQLLNAKNGEKAIVEITNWPDNNEDPIGKVVSVLGKLGSDDVEMSTILLEHGFRLPFPPKVLDQVKFISSWNLDEEIKNRRDLRSVLTITIDPDDAKDFDDAISFRKLGNGNFEIGIHIADVAYYVKPGSPLDKEAYRRATSVYLVDRVLPMLPEKLSNDLCSLRPLEDKLTFSVILTMDQNGKISKSWLGRTAINSNKRFTYDEVQKILEIKEGKFSNELIQLNDIAKKLRQNRMQNGSIAFETTEVAFDLDKDGVPIGIHLKERKDAHLLIEDYMLLANKVVAKSLAKTRFQKRPAPGVYRVHDLPDQEKLKAFTGYASEFGHNVDISTPGKIASSLNKLLKDIKGKGEQDLLEKLAIRSMAKAYYTTKNIGHYGLGFEFYTHFTSPIRRYPDIMVHRLLALYLNNKMSDNAKILEEQCDYSSTMERRAIEAERASVKYKQVQFMMDRVGEEFEGIISGIIDWGIFVELNTTKSEGLIRIETLDDDIYQYNEKELCFKGFNDGKTYKLGDKIKIRLIKADLASRTLDFVQVN